MTSNASLVEMEQELDAIIAMSVGTERNALSIKLHTELERWSSDHADAPPADRTRLDALLGRMLRDVFGVKP